MPTYQFEALDPTGQVIRDVIDASTEEEAHTTIRQMGYFVTKLNVKKSAADGAAGGRAKRKKTFAIGGGGLKALTTFTRQLSILQDAGLPFYEACRFWKNNKRVVSLKMPLWIRVITSRPVTRLAKPWPSVRECLTACTSI